MSKVKKVLKEIILFSFLFFILSNVISYLRQPTLTSENLPVINEILIDGQKFQSPTGKPLVIHFWATWCPTCKLEVSNIEYVSMHYEVVTIAINSGTDTQLGAYMKEEDLSFRVINDRSGKWSKHFNVTAFPTTFIYDTQGQLAFTEVGYTSTAGLLARLKLIEISK